MFISRLKTRSTLATLSVAAFIALLGACTNTQNSDLPKVDENGLVLVEDSKVDIAYRDPDADLSHYNRVLLADAEIAFRKNWLQDQNRDRARSTNRVSQADADKIKVALSAEFSRVFTEELERGGYQVVTVDTIGESAEDVLVLIPGIINLDVTAPDTQAPGRTRTYTASAASMTLVMQFRDSITGDVLGKIADSRRAADRGYMTVTNSVTNRAEADRMLRKWARMLVEGLDNAHGK